MATHHFAHAHDFNIGSLTIHNTNSSRDLEKAFQHLCDDIAIDAARNSAERYDAPKCHEDTRKAVQEEIHGWITHGDEDPEPIKILHLTGPAGAGKTAIAGSIADACDEEGLLAGSFFFASFVASENRRSKRCLVATLAYHLIYPLDDDHPLRRAVLSAVQRDRFICRKRLKDQFRVLLIKPFEDTRGRFNFSDLPKVFIIDGLDEVEAKNSRNPGRDPHDVRMESEGDQEEILSAILHATKDPAFPFRFIIASRPERVIRGFFAAEGAGVTHKIFLDDKYDPDSDIALFLGASFAKIRRRYRLPSSWPSEKDIRELVFNASGQFLYASTVIRFLESGKKPNPKALLHTLLSWQTRGALAALDALYTRILESSPDPLLVVRWIWVNLLLEQHDAFFLNQLLQDYDGQVSYLSENLGSLISTPPAEDRSSAYGFHHKSFIDFLQDESRCGQQLHQSFRGGKDFLLERCVDVFMNKSPAVPLPEPQLSDFLRGFLWNGIIPVFALSQFPPFACSEKLTRCDVAWWVHFDMMKYSEPMRDGVSDWFDDIHQHCPLTPPGDCLPHCKHWRSNILRACKDLGWVVPSVTALFYEAMWRGAHGESDDRWARGSCDLYFDLRDEGPESSVTNPPATLTVDKNYQATVDLVGVVYSRLSADWLPRLKLLGDGDRHMPWPGFATALEKVMQELGIDSLDGYLSEQDTSNDDVGSGLESNEKHDDSDSDDSLLIINNADSVGTLGKAFQHLYDSTAIDAAHNSAERYGAPKCHEDTRRAVQEDIHSWIGNGEHDVEPKGILWLTGPAGAGKTAIAGSVADTCDERGLLAGSFFFASFAASGETRRSKRYLVATLAYHLISALDSDHPLYRAVLSAVQRDRSIFHKRLKDQVRLLFLKPLKDTQGQFDTFALPEVFIIDGLDEVEAENSRQPKRDPHDVRMENEADQEEILSALLHIVNNQHSLSASLLSVAPNE